MCWISPSMYVTCPLAAYGGSIRPWRHVSIEDAWKLPVWKSPRKSACEHYVRSATLLRAAIRVLSTARTQSINCAYARLFITLYKALRRFRVETTRLRLNLRVSTRFKVTTIVQLIISKTVGGQRNIHTWANQVLLITTESVCSCS
jgi:hypothetical protein